MPTPNPGLGNILWAHPDPLLPRWQHFTPEGSQGIPAGVKMMPAGQALDRPASWS